MRLELEMKLQSATKVKLKLERTVNSLRNKENTLTRELLNNKAIEDTLDQQIKELGNELSQMRSQIAIVNVCKESEKAKLDVYASNLDNHMGGYRKLFEKERDILESQREQIHQKETEEKEKGRQRLAEVLAKNEQQEKEAISIEKECSSIEQECSVLLKRNKALMLKLRRKLMETEGIRRQLMKNSEE
ncbi:unnamed protein product [Leptosia nina]|uniref:Uncharacterized protein n=1 Tax=Leptosia nina TaxID=320188 RepID=A0AAV1JQK6_9NEOP